jgi:hypothetical protein
MKSTHVCFVIIFLLISSFGCERNRTTFVRNAVYSFRAKDIKGFEKSLSHVEDVNMKEKNYEYTLLHIIVNEESAMDEEYFEKVIIIFKKFGGDLNAKDLYGRTPLHYCVIKNLSPNIYKTLTAHGADPSLYDKLGRSPLDYLKEQKPFQEAKKGLRVVPENSTNEDTRTEEQGVVHENSTNDNTRSKTF